MITFHSPSNIIVTKRSNYSNNSKNSDKKEKTSNNFYLNNNINNTIFHKTTLSLTSLKLKSKSKKKVKNSINSKTKRKESNVNLHSKRVKSEIPMNKKYLDKKCININNKNILIKKYQNGNDISYLLNNNMEDNKNMPNNFRYNDNINFNSYPKPEPMPIKINKNYNYINTRPITNRNENDAFSPSNILENNNFDIDMNINKSKYCNQEKTQIQNKYYSYSKIQNFFNNNGSKDLIQNKRNNINLINNNNFQNFVQNINNLNKNECFDNNINKNNKKNIYEKKMIYILSSLNLDNLINIFSYNCIGFNDLFLLTKKDLIEMKIPIGQRNRLMHFIEKYRTNTKKNYDFDDIKKYLNIYKNIYINNTFIDRDITNKINTMPNITNYNDSNNLILDNKNENSLKKQKLYLINSKNNKSKISIKKNEIENIKFNDSKIESDNNKLDESNSSCENNIKINNISIVNNLIKNNKNENLNSSTIQGNKDNKNSPTFSSVSNSKAALIDDLNYQDIILLNNKNNQKNFSTITSNLEQNDTTSTTIKYQLINNKNKSNNFLKKCNNILNEVDNFNLIYTQLKQKTQNRNKQISILLNKKNNIEYFIDKIKNKDLKAYKEKEKTNGINNIYSINNDYLNLYNLEELNSLKEESIRDLNKELKLNLWK